MPHLVQINVNPHGGVPKYRIAGTRLTTEVVEGDKQANRRYHGGPERAVCLYSYDLIRDLQEEGHPIEPGTTGENLTISGLDWATLVPGVKLQVGEALLEITSYTVPCYKIADSFVDGKFKRVSQKLHPGWSRLYARVLQEGNVQEGDRVLIL